jgi:hypothetical protein
MRTRVGVLALLPLLSVGCGKIKGGSSDAAPEPDANAADAAPPDPCAAGSEPTFDEAVTCIELAACNLFSRCFAPFEEGQCESDPPFAFFGENSQFNEHAIAEAIEAGIVEYHPEEVASCVALLRETSCREFFSTSGEFRELCPFLSGTVADGEDCIIDFECATPNAVCSEVTKCDVTDVCCVRGCVPPSPVDGECDEFNDTLLCQPGDHCVDNGDIDYCRSGADGAQCEQFGADCDPGLWCQDGVCRPEVESGAACVNDDQCPGPETCLGNDLDGGAVEQLCGRSDREGDPCDGSCSGFECVQPSQSEIGTCVPFLREEGADCSERNCALAGWVCDPGADQCVPRVGVGEVCSDLATQQCVFGLFCTNEITEEGEGVCSGPQADGEPCEQDRQCESGICGGGGPDDSTCQPYPGCF